MKLAHGLRHWYLPIVVLLVLSSVAMGSALVFAQTGSVTSSATPSNATPSIGEQIEVEISIDVSGVDEPDHRLGSFTGSLDWNPDVLAYNSDSDILAGFTGVVNDSDVSSGHIVFNGTLFPETVLLSLSDKYIPKTLFVALFSVTVLFWL